MVVDGQDEATDDAGPPATSDDLELVAALRRGEEQAFATLIDRYHAALVRLALVYVPSYAVAEEVAQETWLGVIQGIARFEGRSSLKTWIFRILTYRARTRGEREGRTVSFSALAAHGDTDASAVEPERFRGAADPYPGHWASPPRDWEGSPEERLLAGETLDQIQKAIALLPLTQQAVITLRDVEGLSGAEVCNVLKISETNQRVLLHRARSKVRRALERYFDEAQA